MNHESRVIVFDWDGTLMDSEATILQCMRAAIDDLGLEPRSDDEIRNIIGLGLKEALRKLYPEGDEHTHEQLTGYYRQHFLDQQREPSPLFAGIRELIQTLAERDYFLAVATGKGRIGLDKVLEETGLGEYFHFTRCADESFSKPHPQMMLDILDYLGVEAHQALMIGDTEYDLQMAHNAGTASLAVSYGVHSKQRLLACEPLHCVDTVNELKDWLLGHNL